jgi:hypothetical protein
MSENTTLLRCNKKPGGLNGQLMLLSEEVSMERAELKRIAEYIEDVEESLERWDTQSIAMERHLTKLHLVIDRLMRTSGEEKDRQFKRSLAILEHRARGCMQCIEASLTVKN